MAPPVLGMGQRVLDRQKTGTRQLFRAGWFSDERKFGAIILAFLSLLHFTVGGVADVAASDYEVAGSQVTGSEVTAGSGLRCYECSLVDQTSDFAKLATRLYGEPLTGNDSACVDEFRPQNRHISEPTKPCRSCMKSKTMKDGRQIWVRRECNPDPHAKEGCQDNRQSDLRVQVCNCMSQLCNAAAGTMQDGGAHGHVIVTMLAAVLCSSSVGGLLHGGL